MAETAGRALPEVSAWGISGIVQLERGDAEAPGPSFDRALEASRTYEISFHRDRGEVALACARAMSGWETGACRLLDIVTVRGVSMSQISPADTEARVAQAYLFTGRPVEAGQAAGRTPSSRLRLLQPEPQVHLAVHRRRGGQVLLRPLAFGRAPLELAEAEVAVGDEGTHAEFGSNGERGAIVVFSA